MTRMLQLALPVLLLLGAICPAQAQYTTDEVKAAEDFAAKFVARDSTEFQELRKKALELAASVRPVEIGVKSLPGARSKVPSIEADPRYKENLAAMVEAQQSGQPRIIGGKRVRPKDFPEVVSVQGNRARCTGVLIAPNVVLTAAHCHCGHINQWVVFGDTIASPTRETTFAVTRSVAMRGCAQPAAGADVALLYLERPSNSQIATVADFELVSATREITAVGFGQTEDNTDGEKRLVDIPVASTTCAGNVGGSPDDRRYGCIKDKEMVAGMAGLNKDTCRGDSGGPVYVRTEAGKLLLAGATSRGVDIKSAHLCGDGGIYELIAGSILDWIRRDNRVSVAVNQ